MNDIRKMTDAELDRAVAVDVMGEDLVRAQWGMVARHRYSTDIAHAFEVVEKMRERWWQFIRHPRSDRWQAIVNGKMSRCNIADTLPRAICEAALDAVRAEATAAESAESLNDPATGGNP